MGNERFRFSPKQRRVLTWWRENRWQAIICDGAIRSGKTFCMGLSFFLWAQHEFSGRQFALCGKTVGALRRNLLTDLVPCPGNKFIQQLFAVILIRYICLKCLHFRAELAALFRGLLCALFVERIVDSDV